MQSIKTKENLIATSSWLDLLLPYEDQLEDITNDIFKFYQKEGCNTMSSNGIIKKCTKHGYVILCDNNTEIFLLKDNYKGWQDSIGTSVLTNMGLTYENKNGRVTYLDSMECVSYDELKYRMFVSLEEEDMVYAATCAWAIYDKAPVELRNQMRECIHLLRNLHRKYNKGELKEELIAA